MLDGEVESLPYDIPLGTVFLLGYAIILSYEGQIASGIFAFAVIIAYMLDAMKINEASLTVVWVASVAEILASWIILLQRLGFSFLSVVLALNVSAFQLLAAVWVTLHVRWMRQYDFGIYCERLLLSSLPFPATTIFSWSITAVFGAKAGLFSSSLILALFYPFVMRLRQKSRYEPKDFDPKYEGPTRFTEMRMANAKARARPYVPAEVAGLQFTLATVLPLFGYMATVRLTALVSIDGLLDSLLLTLIPALPHIADLPNKYNQGGLWWLSLPLSSSLIAKAQGLAFEFVVQLVLVALQIKVVRRSVGAFLSFYTPYPGLVYSIICVASFSLVRVLRLAPSILKQAHHNQDSQSRDHKPPRSRRAKRHAMLFYLHSGIVLSLWSALLGASWIGVLFGAAAGVVGSVFVHERRWWQMLSSIILGNVAFFIVIGRSLGYVDLGLSWFPTLNVLRIAATGIATSLSACLGLRLLASASALKPWLSMTVAHNTITAPKSFPAAGLWFPGFVWTSAVVMLAAVERMLVADNANFETDLYPSYLVVGTTLFGMYITRILRRTDQIGALSRLCSTAMLIAKLSILYTDIAVDGNGFRTLVASFVFAFFTTTPFLEYHPAFAPMPTYLLPVCLVGTGFGLLVDMENTVDVLLRSLVVSPSSGRMPFFIRAFGIAFVICAVALTALAYHYRTRRRLRRGLSVLIFALALILMCHYDPEGNIDEEDANDLDPTASRQKRLALYLATFSLSITGFVATLNILKPVFLVAPLIGAPLGLSINLFFLDHHIASGLGTKVVLMVMVTAFATLVMITVQVHRHTHNHHHARHGSNQPSRSGLGLLSPISLAAFILCSFAIGFTNETFLSRTASVLGSSDSASQATVSLESTSTLVSEIQSILWALMSSLSFLIASLVKYKEQQAHSLAKSSKRKPWTLTSQKSAAFVSPMAIVGNINAVICLGLGWKVLSIRHESEIYGLLLTPVLLLLNRDEWFLRELNAENRYCPPIAAACAFLTWKCYYQVLSSIFEWRRPFNFWFIVKTMGLLFCTTNSMIGFLRYLWKSKAPRSINWLFLTSPLNVLPVIIGDFVVIRLLGACAMAGSLYQIFGSIRLQKKGENRL